VWFVEGEIAVGKSTLLPILKEHLEKQGKKACVVYEPVKLWRDVGILGKFYKDPAAYAYSFQTYTFVTRIDACINAVQQMPDADVYIVERSILTDRNIFMKLQEDVVGADTMKMYFSWFHLHSRLMPFNMAKARYIYLKPSIDQCMLRVEKRGREEEKVANVTRGVPDVASTSLTPETNVTRKTHSTIAELTPGTTVVKTIESVVETTTTTTVIEEQSTDASTPSTTPAGKGGVSEEYQKKLRMAHEAYFQGLHADEFPVAKEDRPFSLGNVLVIKGNVADMDFSKDGKTKTKAAKAIIKGVSQLKIK
jgi:deoxyadenosine/deoxycytidine kinase